MSIYYTVKEHLSIKNYHHEAIADAVIESLTTVGHQMLFDRAFVLELNLTVDGKSYSFNGKEINHDFHEIIRAVSHMNKNLELTFFYDSYDCSFAISETLEDLFKDEPEAADHIFYSIYNNADCSSGSGSISAYGKKNGILYNGMVHYKPLETLVKGMWESVVTVIAFEEDITDALDLDGIRKCANDLEALHADIQFEITDETALLYVNDVMLDTIEKLEKFISICKELQVATNDTCGLMCEFVDYEPVTPSIMILDLFSDDGCNISIQSV